ncbi:tRNA (guanine-N(7)-)-methyltransferase [Mycoplasma sp. CAG:472]|nr:tRNA (guanine-N(7)-)-methyltransferase [Mycoplasma sp. CAG:472]
MRMRNPKNMDEILNSCNYFLTEDLFNNNNDICLEIGMGKGNFLLGMCLNHPDINYIGVEKYSSVICSAIKKINEYELDNLKILNIDIMDIPQYLYGKIKTIYLNFSDPWPKKRNTKRRLTSENFLKLYDNLFKDEKHIILKTDNDDFYEFSKESLLSYGYKIINETYDLHNSDITDSPKTEYEEKFSSQGVKIKYIEVIKK